MKNVRLGLVSLGILFLTVIAANLHSGPALAAPASPGEIYQFPLPGSKTSLTIHLPGFRMEGKIGPDQPYKVMDGTNKQLHMIITGFFEPLGQAPPSHAPASRAAREYHFTQGLARQTVFPLSGVHLWESGPMAGVDYLIKEFRGRKIMQKNYWAFWVKDNVCIRLHISKIFFQPGEERLFTTILNSVRFVAQ